MRSAKPKVGILKVVLAVTLLVALAAVTLYLTLPGFPRLQGAAPRAEPPLSQVELQDTWQPDESAQEQPATPIDAAPPDSVVDAAPPVSEDVGVRPGAPRVWAEPGRGVDKRIERYPTIECPRRVPVGGDFAVQVALTLKKLVEDVAVEVGDVDEQGRVAFELAGAAPWVVDVVLSAEGFRFIKGGNSSEITIAADTDSTWAAFHLKADPDQTPIGRHTIHATFWHRGAFLARVSKEVDVVPLAAPSSMARAETLADSEKILELSVAQSSIAALEMRRASPDLTLFFVSPRNDGAPETELIIASPHVTPAVRVSGAAPPDMVDWIKHQYERALHRSRGLEFPPPRVNDREATIAHFRGLGSELYRKAAPPALRETLEDLERRLGEEFQSILIYSDEAVFPWELMCRDAVDRSEACEFLGVRYRVARWPVGGSQSVRPRPRQRMVLRQFAVSAPQYPDSRHLQHQAEELHALEELPGFVRVGATFDELSVVFSRELRGVFHFAGHGSVAQDTGGVHNFRIDLEDSELDLLAWRGVITAGLAGHPFVFLNACDVGQAEHVADFVEGWGPAALEAGASGYVGGLWPLSDEGAATFARMFYGRVESNIDAGKPFFVADALREARGGFFETGDPTFLAYAYFGDPNLIFYPPRSAP